MEVIGPPYIPVFKGSGVEFEPQLPIEKESGWATEQSGCFGEEENVLPSLGPDGCTVQSAGSHFFQATYWTLFLKFSQSHG
jgi:hypothetical protein